MSDTLPELLATLGPIALAAMGVVVSVIPNLARRNERWLWVGAFLLVGAVVSAANWYELHTANVMQHDIWESETGGDNFAYFDAKQSPSGSAHLVIVNPGNVPIYDFRTDILEMENASGIHDISTMKVIPIRLDEVRPGTTEIEPRLTGKSYWATMTARNGHFFEILDIEYNGLSFSRKIKLFKSIGVDSRNGISVPHELEPLRTN
jgi:hypothetical protein